MITTVFLFGHYFFLLNERVLCEFTSSRCVVVVSPVQTAYTHFHRRRTMAGSSTQIILLDIWNAVRHRPAK